MADMKKHAGGGPEMFYEGSSGYHGDRDALRNVATREEAIRAQDAALRAHAIAEQFQQIGWGGSAEALHRAAREEAARQIAAEPLEAVALGRGIGVEPGVAMYKDKPLLDALCARLAGYCGEGVRNEGAVETLDRLLSEVRAARQGPSHAPAGDTLAQQLRAPGKVFSQDRVLAILRGLKAQWHQRGTELDKGALIAFNDVIHLFENLE